MRRMIRMAIAFGVCGALLVGCSLAGNRAVPKLGSAYGDLGAYWEQVAAALGIDPKEGLLQEWVLSYGDGGSITAQRLVLYADRGAGKYDVYTVNQDSKGRITWNRSRIDDAAPAIAVPAQQFFAGLNAVGFRQLESGQGVTAPVRFWFYTVFRSATYGPDIHTQIVRGGHLSPVGPEGVTMRGTHGTFQMAREIPPGASAEQESPAVYVMPEVGCSPGASGGSEAAHVWVCPGGRQ